MYENPVLIIGLDVPGLGIARSLGKYVRDIFGIWYGSNDEIGRYSKYVNPIKVDNFLRENESKFIDFLIEFGKKFSKKVVLFATDDLSLQTTISHASLLKEYYIFTSPTYDIAKRIINKRELYLLCQKHNISIPNTLIFNEIAEVEKHSSFFSYPVLLKPYISQYWHSPNLKTLVGEQKVIVCNNPSELLESCEKIYKLDKRFLIQEIVEGEDKNLFYMPTFCKENGEIMSFFIGQKLRMFPPHFGRGCYVKSVSANDILSLSKKLLKSIQYFGLVGIEYKFDKKEKEFKLIEINARYGLWDVFGLDLGVNLALAAYKYCAKLEETVSNGYHLNKYWNYFEPNIRRAIKERKAKDLIATIVDAIRANSHAIFNMNDIKPCIYWGFRFLAKNLISASSKFKAIWKSLK